MARFTQDRMYEMLGEISKKQKPIYKTGGLKEADCPFGYSLVNGKCVPDPDCEDGQCRETDEIQAIYDKADSIPNKVAKFEHALSDELWVDPKTGNYKEYIIPGKPGSDARELWKKHGVTNFVDPSCMYVAGLGWRCTPETKDYMSNFNPVHFNSNIGFINAVDRGDVPFTRVGKFSDPTFDNIEKGNLKVGDVVNFKGADNSHAMTFMGYDDNKKSRWFDSNGMPAHVGVHRLWEDFQPNASGKGRDYAYVNRFDKERYIREEYGDEIEQLEKQSRENPTFYKQGGLTQYAPGGVSADPPDWLTKKGANVYFNPAYQNNFTGAVNTNQSYFNNIPVFKQDPAAVFGIEGSLSKNRNAKKEAGRGWLYNAYVGMPYSQVIGDNAQYKPSAGIKFDFENALQDKKFIPHIEAALDYNMHTGPLVSLSGGARYAITPWGNKLVKPGYGVGHVDLYGGFGGGGGAEGGGAGLNYGARIQGKYQPRWLDRLSRGSYLYGEAGIQFDPVKGKNVQKQTDQEWTGGQDQVSGQYQQMVTPEKDPGIKWGSTVYANVGIKKDIDDIKFKNNKRSKKIQDIEDEEKYAERKSQEEEVVEKKEKLKKECPEGERRYCENCPCEPIEKHKHPRWLRDGGLIQYAEGGEPCPDGYIRNENGQCIPANYEPNVAKENTDFLKSMVNSPLFAERYARMVGKPLEEVQEEAELYKEQMIQNLQTVGMGDSSNPPESFESLNAGAYYKPPYDLGDHNSNMNEVQNMLNSVPDKGKYNKEIRGKYQSLLDDYKSQADELSSVGHKLYFKDWNKDFDLHERSHASTKGRAGITGAYDYNYRDMSKPRSDSFSDNLEHTIWSSHYPKENPETGGEEYYTQLTELKARKDIAAKKLQELGLYDPVNENFTQDHYKKLVDLMKNPDLDENTRMQIRDIVTPFTKEDTIRMFNDIVQKDSNTNTEFQTQTARFGGQSNFEKVTLLNKFFRQ